MPRGKIIYQNWIAELGFDPACFGRLYGLGEPPVRCNQQVIEAVRIALLKLSPAEKEFIEQYYFEGRTYASIAKSLKKRISRVDGLHRRAVARLKRELASFVKKEFDIEAGIGRDCPLCQSSHRKEIDIMIANKRPEETWRALIGTLKTKYQIEIKTPQILIGHQKYHMR